MDRVNAIQVFIRVVETCSFSKAAAELGITQPTATKAIAGTEERLGVRLLHRSTRGVTPTEVGTQYYARCKAIERAIDEAENHASQAHNGAGGLLRISTSVAFGRRILVPLALGYMQANPAVLIDISFDDRYVDLVEQGMDLAIRMGQMADSSLGARYLGSNPWVMVASQAYMDRCGQPAEAADLARHACIVYSSVQGDDRWRLTASAGPAAGRAVSVPVSGPFRSNNLSAILAAASAGMGLAILPWYVAREAILAGAVQVVMADHGLPAQEMHAVYPSPKLVPQKVTRFIGYLQQALAGDWWQRAVQAAPAP
ncbi:LysR family transcriptional regulator [Pseudorhodoferax sp.]|uniref:LysR family transcriptional regulator n=1 Tax=Pseudorhodoferax sp. TaxID=1993553 RepID=UPI002DD69C91|nr:LysR family transcriptional regulator [Pseudorhodoferax sp.]